MSATFKSRNIFTALTCPLSLISRVALFLRSKQPRILEFGHVLCWKLYAWEESVLIAKGQWTTIPISSKPDVEKNSVSKVFEPFLYFKLKPEACEGHGSDDHVIFTGEDGVVTHTDVPAINILYPPPRICIIDCNGEVHVRDLQKLGDFCKFCCGTGRCIKCLYFKRCRACLVLFAEMENNGKRHFCVEGIESIPKDPRERKPPWTCNLSGCLPRGKNSKTKSSPQGLMTKCWLKSRRNLKATRRKKTESFERSESFWRQFFELRRRQLLFS